MTISTVDDRIEYTGTGSAPQNYTIPFVYYEDSEIILKTLTGISAGSATSTTLVDPTNYTLTGGDGATGTANVTTPVIATNELLLVQRIEPLTQLFAFDGSGSFPTAKAQETADRCTLIAQQTNGDLAFNSALDMDSDVVINLLGTQFQLNGGLVAHQIVRSGRYNILASFNIASNFVANSPVTFDIHVGPLGTISDPIISNRKIFFPGTFANTIYNFPVGWLNIFLSSTQKITFSATSQFSVLTIKDTSAVLIREYVEKT